MCDGDDCCKTFSKVLLVIVNLFFFLLGLLMLAFGIAMVVAPDKVATAVMNVGDLGTYMKLLGDAGYIVKAAGIFMIVLGGIVTLIGGFGFFGACCENRVLLILYLIVVIIILLAEVALIIFAACFPAALMTTVQTEMNKTMIDDFKEDVQVYPNVSLGATDTDGYAWAALQFGTKCCGTYGPSDYNNGTRYSMPQRSIANPYLNGMDTPVNYPVSCCALNSGVNFPNIGVSDFKNLQGCLYTFPLPAAAGSYNTKNCYDSVRDSITQAAKIAIGIAAAIVGVEIIIIILGFILCCAIQKSKSLMV